MTERTKMTLAREVELVPFSVPVAVGYDSGDNAIALGAVTQEALDDLAGEWLEGLYKAANKRYPWENVTTRCDPTPAPAPIMAVPAPTGVRDLFRDLEYLGQAAAHAEEGPLGEPAARAILAIAQHWASRMAPHKAG